jgi:acetolactate synthase-1/2/3 large subunit
MIGKGAFQETDIYGMTLPVVKHSYLVTDVNDIPRSSRKPFTSPRTAGRTGPD